MFVKRSVIDSIGEIAWSGVRLANSVFYTERIKTIFEETWRPKSIIVRWVAEEKKDYSSDMIMVPRIYHESDAERLTERPSYNQ